MIVIGKGTVWVGDGETGRRRVAELGPGEILGESALLEAGSARKSHRHSATIIADTPCLVLRISMRTMRNLIDRNPDLKDRIQADHDRRTAGSQGIKGVG